MIRLGAGGFALGLLALAASASFRARFREVFSLPQPANQAVIEPFDSIRGFSALWVAYFHAWQWMRPTNDPGWRLGAPQGFLAVPVFVAMSAFLIYRTLKPVSSLSDTAAYFKRRWLRIYPLYFVTVLAIALGGYAAGDPPGAGRLLAELSMARLFGYPEFLNPPAWSLYVEEGFYILAPLWFFVFRRRPAAGALLTYAALSWAEAAWSFRELDLLRYFCVGILLTDLLDRGGGIREAVKWAVLATGLFLGLVTLCSETTGWPYYYLYYPASVTRHLFAVAVLGVLWSSVNLAPVRRVLSLYPFRFLGTISYSVYLWHSLLVVSGTPIRFDGSGGIVPQDLSSLGAAEAVRGPLSFYLLYGTAFVFFGSLSYALIERPFLLMRRKVAAKASPRPEGIAIIGPYR